MASGGKLAKVAGGMEGGGFCVVDGGVCNEDGGVGTSVIGLRLCGSGGGVAKVGEDVADGEEVGGGGLGLSAMAIWDTISCRVDIVPWRESRELCW